MYASMMSLVFTHKIRYTYLRIFLLSMARKVVKSTSRGQITLPKTWRSNFNTDCYLIEMKDDVLIVTPVDVEDLQSEEVLFDADRDNHGHGISVDDMIETLQTIRNG